MIGSCRRFVHGVVETFGEDAPARDPIPIWRISSVCASRRLAHSFFLHCPHPSISSLRHLRHRPGPPATSSVTALPPTPAQPSSPFTDPDRTPCRDSRLCRRLRPTGCPPPPVRPHLTRSLLHHVFQHYFNTAFQQRNNVFLSQQISISSSQISTKQTGPLQPPPVSGCSPPQSSL